MRLGWQAQTRKSQLRKVRVGIAGLGTVAQGVLTLLGRNHQLILERTGLSIDVVRVASRRAKEVDLLGADFSTQLSDLVTDERVDIVLELIGGEQEAHQLIQDALAAGG
ncbi:MAG TPA: homoserine dehydrogenase, partial [Gammaproteobacteria bacterium]|nr:homoserine dehydrogenase [Gammaproteobacteria bacterium]